MFPLKDNIPTDRVPVVTIALIVACTIVYFFLQGGGITHGPSDAEVVKWGAIPWEVTHPGKDCALSGSQLVCGAGVPSNGPSAWLTLLSSMFMHGSILHLAGNMLFLWIFGGNVEDAMARWRFLVFYLLGGLAAIGLQIAIHPDAVVPTVGASGAIAAVLGGYIVLYPRARVVTVVFVIFFFTLIELPAFVMLGVWFLEQALVGASSLASPAGDQGGGVAYFAHVGGFVFGLATIRLFATRRKRQPPALPAWSS